jgi:hypothetical protein
VQLVNEFRVPVPVNQAWDVLTDVERIAPCLPGAQLLGVEGDEYHGAVSGAKTAMIPGADFAWFPLANPGIVSIPLAFILGIVGTLSSRDRGDPVRNAEMEVRSLTGIGAEQAVGMH